MLVLSESACVRSLAFSAAGFEFGACLGGASTCENADGDTPADTVTVRDSNAK